MDLPKASEKFVSKGGEPNQRCFYSFVKKIHNKNVIIMFRKKIMQIIILSKNDEF